MAGSLNIMLFLLLSFNGSTIAIPSYRDRIPNGKKIPDPCNPGSIWGAVGHIQPHMGSFSTLNSFGRDFKKAGFQWTMELCQKDSDEDGLTNGEELGDPFCNWTPKSFAPMWSLNISHPGICDPITCIDCWSINRRFLNKTNCPLITGSTAKTTTLTQTTAITSTLTVIETTFVSKQISTTAKVTTAVTTTLTNVSTTVIPSLH